MNALLRIKRLIILNISNIFFFFKFQIYRDIKKSIIKDTVLIISETPTARIRNIGLFLREQGWKVNFMFKKETNYSSPSYDYSKIGNIYYYVSSYQALLYYANSDNFLVHFIDQPTLTLSLFVKYYSKQTIYAPIDIFDGTMNENNKNINKSLKKTIRLQNNIINKSKYIIFRDLQIKSSKEFKSYKIKDKKILFFHDYVTSTELTKPLINNEKTIKIVSIGNLRTFDYKNGKAYLDFAKKLVNNGCEFHIYPHYHYFGGNKNKFLQHHPYYKELLSNKFFFIHQSVKEEKLKDELTQYDYGILLNGEHFYNMYGSNKSLWIKKYFFYNAGSRVVDYINSGLNLIITKSEPTNFQYFVGSRYANTLNANEVMESDNCKQLLYTNRSSNKNNIETFSYKHNIKRLVSFYSQIIEENIK